MKKDILDKAYDLKKQLWSYNDIGVELGYDPSYIRSELKKHGYDLTGLSSKKTKKVHHYDKDELYERAISLRKEGYSVIEIAKQINVLPNVLNKWNIGNLNNNPNALARHKKDASIFENYTKEGAYFLGLLFSDGNIREERVRIELQKRDCYILESFRDLVAPTVSLSDHGDCSRLEFSFIHLIKVLEGFGYGYSWKKQNKLNLSKIPSKHFNHFIRGYFDGDGSIKKPLSVDFNGPETLVRQIKESLKVLIGVGEKSSMYYFKGRDYSSRFSFSRREEVKTFFYWLYEDANLYLTRKQEKFNALLWGNSKVI